MRKDFSGLAQRHCETPWLSKGAEKSEAVRSIFDRVAGSYDLVNSLMSLTLHHKWRRQAVETLNLAEGDTALDVCSGTGDFCLALREKVGQSGTVVGIDFCQPMLDIAHDKLGDSVTLALGDACQLPLRSESFDAVTVGWGLRNVPDIDKSLREIYRVLKPGGRFVSIDMARPTGRLAGISEKICHSVVPALGTLFGQRGAYVYLNKSTKEFASRDELSRRFELAGFSEVVYEDHFGGNICEHFGRKL